MSSTIPIDARKWALAKSLANKIYDKPSAYKSGYIVKKYKELGGKFRTTSKTRASSKSRSKSPTGLTRWFAEKWVNQHGAVGYKHKNDVYRPSIRITKHTPVTWSELDKKQITRASRIKASGKRVSRFIKK